MTDQPGPHALELPFVMVESAPRKRGKTFFNIHILPQIATKFRKIHIFTPSLLYQDDYWTEFHADPRYELHSDVSPDELTKVITTQQAFVSGVTAKRRQAILKKEKDEKGKKGKRKKEAGITVEFQPAYHNGRRKRRKRQWHVEKGVQLHYTIEKESYDFLMPDILTGAAIDLKNTLKEAKNPKPEDLMDILIILDDCVDEGLFDAWSSGAEVAFRGRHYYVSMICCTQQLTKISYGIRCNIDYILFWSPHSVQELESFIEKFVSKNHLKKFRLLLQQAFDRPHEFILLNPHALDAIGRFWVGEMNNFLGGTMRPLLTDALLNEIQS